MVTGSDKRLLMLSGLMLGSGQIYLESICCVWVSAAVELKTAINVRTVSYTHLTLPTKRIV